MFSSPSAFHWAILQCSSVCLEVARFPKTTGLRSCSIREFVRVIDLGHGGNVWLTFNHLKQNDVAVNFVLQEFVVLFSVICFGTKIAWPSICPPVI